MTIRGQINDKEDRPISRIILAGVILGTMIAPTVAQARPSEWWYVADGVDRVLFVDEPSIERTGDEVRYSASQILREEGNPVANMRSFMRADCKKRTQSFPLIMRYGRDDQPLDPAATSYEEMQAVEPGTLGEAELNFVCAPDRNATSGFPISIDDLAFAEALIANHDTSVTPAAIHARLFADPATPIIRSAAPAPETFGRPQVAKVGKPIVPPRDYARGTEPPEGATYDADETGRIYDVVYMGIDKDELLFEIRGYSISDMVHPGSGQTSRIPIGVTHAQINDLSVTIIEARADSLRYKVVRQLADPSAVPDIAQ